LLGGVGLAAMAAALLLLAALGSHVSAALIGGALAVVGFGFGFFQTPNNRVLLAVPAPDRVGGAGGMTALARLIGQIGGALLVTLVFSIWADGARLTLLIACGLAALGAVVSFSRMPLHER